MGEYLNKLRWEFGLPVPVWTVLVVADTSPAKGGISTMEYEAGGLSPGEVMWLEFVADHRSRFGEVAISSLLE